MPSAILAPDFSGRPLALRCERLMQAPPAAVYRAWTEQFDLWFAAPGSVLMPGKSNTPFFFETHFEGQRHPHYGRFLRLTRNRRVEMTWVTAATGGAETLVMVDLAPANRGTLLRLQHSGFADEKSRDRHQDAWPKVLAHMDECLNSAKKPKNRRN
jgi:uncharacterized protein YndB with AHSA1/START domain